MYRYPDSCTSTCTGPLSSSLHSRDRFLTVCLEEKKEEYTTQQKRVPLFTISFRVSLSPVVFRFRNRTTHDNHRKKAVSV